MFVVSCWLADDPALPMAPACRNDARGKWPCGEVDQVMRKLQVLGASPEQGMGALLNAESSFVPGPLSFVVGWPATVVISRDRAGAAGATRFGRHRAGWVIIRRLGREKLADELRAFFEDLNQA